jgi:hypothetical protein
MFPLIVYHFLQRLVFYSALKFALCFAFCTAFTPSALALAITNTSLDSVAEHAGYQNSDS